MFSNLPVTLQVELHKEAPAMTPSVSNIDIAWRALANRHGGSSQAVLS